MIKSYRGIHEPIYIAKKIIFYYVYSNMIIQNRFKMSYVDNFVNKILFNKDDFTKIVLK